MSHRLPGRRRRTVGSGLVPGWVSHVELMWEEPSGANFFERLASFSRLIVFDKRGTGLSDRVPDAQLPTHEERMDDIRAVMDAAGSRARGVLRPFRRWQSGRICSPPCYPQRTTALVIFGSFAKRIWAPDYPWAPTPEQREREYELVAREWGGDMDPRESTFRASSATNAYMRRLRGLLPELREPRRGRRAAANEHADRHPRCACPRFTCPTLILHRVGDQRSQCRPWAATWPNTSPARAWSSCPETIISRIGDSDVVLDEIEEFLTGVRPAARHRSRARHRAVHRHRRLDRARGAARRSRLARAPRPPPRDGAPRARRVFAAMRSNTTGDGFLATFDGPARAIRCAAAIRDGVARLGLDIRAGLHTGEIEHPRRQHRRHRGAHRRARRRHGRRRARCWCRARSRIW